MATRGTGPGTRRRAPRRRPTRTHSSRSPGPARGKGTGRPQEIPSPPLAHPRPPSPTPARGARVSRRRELAPGGAKVRPPGSRVPSASRAWPQREERPLPCRNPCSLSPVRPFAPHSVGTCDLLIKSLPFCPAPQGVGAWSKESDTRRH